MFRELGPDARARLGVVAFFSQGIDERNLEWLFPTILNGTAIFDKFCILSLTYRSNGFITMLAPLRDYLSPKDPKSSSVLHTTKERYYTRMLVEINPNKPNFEETQWITSEDVNVEYLLDVFTTIDPDSDNIWDVCVSFMQHLYWHKKRPTILQLKIEGLPDDHDSKPSCLYVLSRFFESVGNLAECKRLLVDALKLTRERWSDHQVAMVLKELSSVNRLMGLHEEGIQRAREALEIYEELGETARQVECLVELALSLSWNEQFDAAEEAALRATNILPEKGEQFLVCESHKILGDIYRSKGETEKAVHHLELALGIASSFNWNNHLFWVHYSLTQLFLEKRKFDDAHAHIEHAKSHTADSIHNLGLTMELQAVVLYEQGRLEEARCEALRAAEIYEKLGITEATEACRKLAQLIQEGPDSPVASGQSASDRELL